MTPLDLPNPLARRLWLHVQGLDAAPRARSTHDDVLGSVERLGMVQLDPLATVARAHHHILWSRHSDWRPARYDTLLERRRSVFEHFTHDAAILPMSMWPYWARARRLRAERYARGAWGSRLPPAREIEAIVDRIARDGPLCSADFDSGPADRSVHAWMRPPHKLALEHLWLEGRLAVARRRRFVKFYDRVERVVPDALRGEVRTEPEQIDFLCRAALARLGFATPGELQRFWEAVSGAEVRAWLDAHPDAWRAVRVRGADGAWRDAVAPRDVEDALDEATARAATAARACSTRSIRSCEIARAGSPGCSASTTGSRSTCRPRSGATATTCTRCSTALVSSAGSRRARCAVRTGSP